MVALPDKPGIIALIDSEKGNILDVGSRKFLRSIPNWDGSYTKDGRYGLYAPPSGGMDILDLRTGEFKVVYSRCAPKYRKCRFLGSDR